MPAAINLSLALELYLKALHITNGRNPAGHHLWKLFKNLPQTQKETIEEKYQEQCQATPKDRRELKYNVILVRRSDQEKELDDETPSLETAREIFLLHDNAFEAWRYLHEIPEPGGYVYEYDFGAMDIMIKVVREFVYEVLQKRGPRMGLEKVKPPSGGGP